MQAGFTITSDTVEGGGIMITIVKHDAGRTLTIVTTPSGANTFGVAEVDDTDFSRVCHVHTDSGRDALVSWVIGIRETLPSDGITWD